MNGKWVRTVLFLAIGAFASTLALAQEETETPRKVVPKAAREAKAKAVAKKAEARAKAEAEQKARALNINTATQEELKKLPGITEELAQRIIKNRPYYSKAHLVTKDAIPAGTYQSIRKLVFAGPLPAQAK